MVFTIFLLSYYLVVSGWLKIVQINRRAFGIAGIGWALAFATLIFSPFGINSTYAETANSFNIEDYGRLPQIRAMDISPSGNRFAWIQEGDTNPRVVIFDANKKALIASVELATSFKARNLLFANDNYLILSASKTRAFFSSLNRHEVSGAVAYNIKDNKVKPLLTTTRGINPYQTGLGRVIGATPNSNHVFMPAWGDNHPVRYNLYKVNLKTGKGKRVGKGRRDTRGWFIDAQGKIIAREDFDEDAQVHSLYSYLDKKPQEVYRLDTKLPKLDFLAVSKDAKSLLFLSTEDNQKLVKKISLVDGSISKPLYSIKDGHIDALLVSNNSQFIGTVFSGLKPSYKFVDQQLQTQFDKVAASFPGSSIYLRGSSHDLQQWLIQVSGNDFANAYLTFNRATEKFTFLAREYPQIDQHQIAEITAIEYPARDGLSIPAVITWPEQAKTNEQRKQLPLIVLPHGGPNTYDSVRFNWLTQTLAKLGYLVLQPNYRGSTGFGNEFHKAGFGRWGLEMQDDITDGVNFLIENGVVNKERVCILGASYGGYAALVGGVSTPELYQCVISINGISDIKDWVDYTIDHAASDGEWLENYWEQVFGNSKERKADLKQVSPLFFADKVTAPILLIHGKSDTRVPIEQSVKMHKALKEASKNSEIVILEGEDHWLSTSDSRLQTLQLIKAFLSDHNPVSH